MKLSCIETSEIAGNDVYASSFLTIFRFGVERSGTENQKRRALIQTACSCFESYLRP